jgi:cell division protein FtsB
LADGRAKRKFKVTPGIIGLFLLVLYFVFLIRSDWSVLSELGAQRAWLEDEIARRTEERTRLRREITLLDSPAYIELLAREKLGLVKPGETAYKVVR